jgi:hypothetical protein
VVRAKVPPLAFSMYSSSSSSILTNRPRSPTETKDDDEESLGEEYR